MKAYWRQMYEQSRNEVQRLIDQLVQTQRQLHHVRHLSANSHILDLIVTGAGLLVLLVALVALCAVALS